MATNGKDPFRQLVADVEELKASSRSMSERLSSVSDTMALAAKTLASMSKAMSNQERLYERVARVLIAFKARTDERFDNIEDRLHALESSRH